MSAKMSEDYKNKQCNKCFRHATTWCNKHGELCEECRFRAEGLQPPIKMIEQSPSIYEKTIVEFDPPIIDNAGLRLKIVLDYFKAAHIKHYRDMSYTRFVIKP